MLQKKTIDRRQFLKKATKIAAGIVFPYIVPSSALGKADSVVPSERITLGYDLCFGKRQEGAHVCCAAVADADGAECDAIAGYNTASFAQSRRWNSVWKYYCTGGNLSYFFQKLTSINVFLLRQ